MYNNNNFNSKISPITNKMIKLHHLLIKYQNQSKSKLKYK